MRNSASRFGISRVRTLLLPPRPRRIRSGRPCARRWDETDTPRLPPPHERVRGLVIETARPLDLSTIKDWPSLQRLDLALVPTPGFAPALDLTPLAGLAGLEVNVSLKGVGVPLELELVGAELLGDRLTVHD
ncbi:hypothetical protein [Streptomyces hebeiensis]